MFKELYYWMATQLSKIKSNNNPLLNAYFLIVIFQSFNCGTLFLIVNYFTKVHFVKNAHVYIGVSLTSLLCIINYFLLYAKRKIIFEKYDNLSPKRRTKGLFCFWLYVLLSIIVFFVAAANL
jgi:hypothetical protein